MSTARAPLNRCEVCAGRKKMAGLGGIVKDCANCKGVGWLVGEDATKSEAKRLEAQLKPEPEIPVETKNLKTPKGKPVNAKVKAKRKPKKMQQLDIEG